MSYTSSTTRSYQAKCFHLLPSLEAVWGGCGIQPSWTWIYNKLGLWANCLSVWGSVSSSSKGYDNTWGDRQLCGLSGSYPTPVMVQPHLHQPQEGPGPCQGWQEGSSQRGSISKYPIQSHVLSKGPAIQLKEKWGRETWEKSLLWVSEQDSPALNWISTSHFQKGYRLVHGFKNICTLLARNFIFYPFYPPHIRLHRYFKCLPVLFITVKSYNLSKNPMKDWLKNLAHHVTKYCMVIKNNVLKEYFRMRWHDLNVVSKKFRIN